MSQSEQWHRTLDRAEQLARTIAEVYGNGIEVPQGLTRALAENVIALADTFGEPEP